MPYHSRSESIEKDLSFSIISADRLANIIKSLGIKSAFFADLSLGSMIVQRMSVRHPELVKAEIHISGSSLHPKPPKILKLLIPFIYATIKLFPDDMFARTFASDKALREDTIAYMVEAFKQTGKEAIIHLMSEIVREMAASLPEHPAKPRMIVYGDHEKPFVIKTSRKWNQRLSVSELDELENAHHILNQDNPAAFNKELFALIKRIE